MPGTCAFLFYSQMIGISMKILTFVVFFTIFKHILSVEGGHEPDYYYDCGYQGECPVIPNTRFQFVYQFLFTSSPKMDCQWLAIDKRGNSSAKVNAYFNLLNN